MAHTVAVIPKINLPAEVVAQLASLNGAADLDAGVSAGFPVMSIKGAKWRVIESGEEHPVYMPGTRDLAPFVHVVLLRANSAISKVYYAGQYVEGSDEKPTCYSNDGIRPASDVEDPQSDLCATCVKNAWGSKISPSGAKIKACADVRRVAVLPADDLTYSPMLLRVPGASLSDLAKYGRALKQRNIPYAAVVTKLSFDPDAAYPKIMFQYERVLTAEEMAQVASRVPEPIVDDILGLNGTPFGPTVVPRTQEDEKFNIPANVQAPAGAPAEPEEPAQAAPAPAPRKRAPRAAPAAQAAPAPAPEPAPAAQAASGLEDEIAQALAEINLD